MDDVNALLSQGLTNSPFGVGQDTTFCGIGACSANEYSDKLALLWERYDTFGVTWTVGGLAAGSILTTSAGDIKALFAENQGVGFVDPVLGTMKYSRTSQFTKNGALTNTCAAYVVAAMSVMPRALFLAPTKDGNQIALAYHSQTAYYHTILTQQLFSALSMRFRSEYQGCNKEVGPAELWQSALGVRSPLLASNGGVSVQYPAPAFKCLFVMPNNQVNDTVDLLVTGDYSLAVEVEAANPPTCTTSLVQEVTVFLHGFAVPAVQGLCGDMTLVGGKIQPSGGTALSRG